MTKGEVALYLGDAKIGNLIKAEAGKISKVELDKLFKKLLAGQRNTLLDVTDKIE